MVNNRTICESVFPYINNTVRNHLSPIFYGMDWESKRKPGEGRRGSEVDFDEMICTVKFIGTSKLDWDKITVGELAFLLSRNPQEVERVKYLEGDEPLLKMSELLVEYSYPIE